jgi:hypothetical protein
MPGHPDYGRTQRTIQREADAEGHLAAGERTVERQREGERADRVGRNPCDRPPLADRLARAAEVERLEVAQPAVNRAQVVERRAAAEVVALDQRDRQAAQRGVVGDCQTVNAAAHDQDVEGAGGQLVQIARHACHLSGPGRPVRYSLAVATTEAVREYWNRHIHDLEITRHPVGSRGFFDDSR